MSRRYEIQIIVEADPKLHAHITEIIEEEWGCDDRDSEGNNLVILAESSLCGGETEEEFTQRIAHAIWKECGFVPVQINATCLEYIPYETYHQIKEDFELWKENCNGT